MKFRSLCFLLFALGAMPAHGYKLSGNYWSGGTSKFYVGMPGTSAGGVSWSQSLTAALNQWTEKTSFRFEVVNQYRNPCTDRVPGKYGDGLPSADFAGTACGQAFGTNVLAITLTAGQCFKSDCSTGFDISDADILFNNQEQWDVYTGPRRVDRGNDFGRVALHELGHAIGLQHELVNTAIMQATISSIESLQPDDISGANALYGTPVARDDQSSNLLASIYGIGVILPADNAVSGARSVSLNGVLESSDSLLEGRFIDIFQYTLTQDTAVDLRMTSTDFNAFVYLARMDSTQQPIAANTYTDDNGGGDLNARLVRNLPAGTYWIGAASSAPGQRGNYTLSLSVAAGTTPSFTSYDSKYGIPVQINPNSLIVGSLGGDDRRLDSGQFIDVYEFSVRQSVTLRIDLSSSVMDTQLYLTRLVGNQDFDAEVFHMNNNGGVGTNARLIRTLPVGTYWLGATSFGAAVTGDYRIDISVVP